MRPLPSPSPDARPYWEAARRHELVLPYCRTCAKYFFYPRPFCPRDFSWEVEWRRASGGGTLYAYSIVYRAQQPGFETPYITALVEVEDGARIMTSLVGVEPDPSKIRIGMPVEVVFEDLNDEVAIPKFRPVDPAL